MISNPKEIEYPHRLFITGIDTDAGKSFATGWLARCMLESGKNVITQKFVQTGNREFSEDILLHRKIMGSNGFKEDLNHLTAPEIFSYPCSPDLAAEIDCREIDLKKISNASDKLNSKFDYLLIEGAGGLMVPLKGDYLTIDYIIDNNLPIIIVTNGTLGSINHTLLTLEYAASKNIRIFTVIYNTHFDTDEIISASTKSYIQNWLSEKHPDTYYIEMPSLNI